MSIPHCFHYACLSIPSTFFTMCALCYYVCFVLDKSSASALRSERCIC